MFLEVVSLARDISHDGLSRRQFDSRDLTVRRVGLLGFHRQNLRADTLLLTVLLQRGRDGDLDFALGFAPHGLVEC